MPTAKARPFNKVTKKGDDSLLDIVPAAVAHKNPTSFHPILTLRLSLQAVPAGKKFRCDVTNLGPRHILLWPKLFIFNRTLT